MSKRIIRQQVLRLLALSLIVLLLGGGSAFLLHAQQSAPTHARTTSSLATCSISNSFLCAPTLPGSYVDTILRQMGSPMVGVGQTVENAARAQNIDDAFALGVWWTETNDGAAGVGSADNNPGSVRGSIGYPSAFDGYTIYPSFTAAVTYWFSMIKNVYVTRGMTTVYSMAHTYVGTSSSGLWAGKVTSLMLRYRADAPQIVTPTPTPTISANTSRHAQSVATAQAQLNTGYTGTSASIQTAPQTSLAQQHIQLKKTPSTTTNQSNSPFKIVLIPVALVLVLFLALLIFFVRRRITRNKELATLLAGKPHERQPGLTQQPISLFNNTSSFSELKRTTERLSFSPNTESMSVVKPISSSFTAQAPSSFDSFPSTPIPSFISTSVVQPTSTASTPPQQAFTGETPGLKNMLANRQPVSEVPFGTSATSASSQQAFTDEMFRPEIPFIGVGADQPPFADHASVSERPLANRSSAVTSFQTFRGSRVPEESIASSIRRTERSVGVNMPETDGHLAQNSTGMPRRTRLLPSQAGRSSLSPSEIASDRERVTQQRVPVSIGASDGHSGGLLSRYREKQSQESEK